MNIFKQNQNSLPSNTSKMPYVLAGIFIVVVLAALFVVPTFFGGNENEGGKDNSKSGQNTNNTSVSTGSLSAAGDGFVCTAEGKKITCLGQNNRAQLGSLNVTDHENSFDLDGEVKEIAAGAQFACASTGKSVSCWGDNRWKSVGDIKDLMAVPTKIPAFNGKTVASISAGEDFACALVNSEIFCWGADNAAQLGSGIEGSSANGIKKVDLPNGVVPVRLVSSGFSTFFLTEKGEWYGFGSNYEQRITDDSMPYLPPTLISEPTQDAKK